MDDEFTLSQYLTLLRRHWRTLVIAFGAVLVAAIALSLLQPVTYRARVVLVAQPQKYAWRLDPSFQSVSEDLRLDRRSDYSTLITERLLGRQMAGKVIAKLGDALPAKLRDPAHMKSAVEVKNGPGRLLYLDVTAPSEELAQTLARTWTEIWVAEADARFGQSADRIEFEGELNLAKQRLDAASQALVEFRTRTGLALELGGELATLREGTLVAGLPLLQQKIVLNNSSLAEYQVALDRIRLLKERAEAARAAGSPVSSLPLELLDVPLLVERGQVTRASVEGEQAGVAGLVAKLEAEGAELSQTIERLTTETAGLQGELAGLFRERDRLLREYDLTNEAFKALQRKLTELDIQEQVSGASLSPVNADAPAISQATPNWIMNMGLAVLLGALAGMVVVFGGSYARSFA